MITTTAELSAQAKDRTRATIRYMKTPEVLDSTATVVGLAWLAPSPQAPDAVELTIADDGDVRVAHGTMVGDVVELRQVNGCVILVPVVREMGNRYAYPGTRQAPLDGPAFLALGWGDGAAAKLRSIERVDPETVVFGVHLLGSSLPVTTYFKRDGESYIGFPKDVQVDDILVVEVLDEEFVRFSYPAEVHFARANQLAGLVAADEEG